jgi:hypothetical protein
MLRPDFVLLVCILVSALSVRESPGPDYVGAERCRRCHRGVHDTWSRTAHERATERIGVESPDRGCLDCHATGPASLRGVQCEACHGPGSRYARPQVMLDPEKAKEAGLIEPTESVCRTCHGSGLPGHASSFTMPGEADRRHAIH